MGIGPIKYETKISKTTDSTTLENIPKRNVIVMYLMYCSYARSSYLEQGKITQEQMFLVIFLGKITQFY